MPSEKSPKKEAAPVWLAERAGLNAAVSCLAASLTCWLLANGGGGGGGLLDWWQPANQVRWHIIVNLCREECVRCIVRPWMCWNALNVHVMSSSPYSLPKFNRKILPQNFLEMLYRYFFYSVDARLDFVGFEIFAESGSICVFQTLF